MILYFVAVIAAAAVRLDREDEQALQPQYSGLQDILSNMYIDTIVVSEDRIQTICLTIRFLKSRNQLDHIRRILTPMRRKL